MKAKIVFLMYLLLSVSYVVSAQPEFQVTYLIPSDERANSSKLKEFEKILSDVQSFYANEMERHGFGRKTFAYKKEIKIYRGRHTLQEYLSDHHLIWFEFAPLWVLISDHKNENVADIVFIEGTERLGGKAVGRYQYLTWGRDGKPGFSDFGYYLISLPAEDTSFLGHALAHEIGHIPALGHPKVNFENGKRKVMGPNDLITNIQDLVFTFSEAKIIDRSIFFEPLKDSDIEVLDADVNNDGYVDLSDVLIVRSAIKHKNSYETDVNGDGKTDEIDVLIVKQKAMEAIVAAAPSLKRRKITTWGTLKRK
ncbi:hypothetical protein F4X88_12800 [Candidatus Poribacteria bacterium]|nr:hypothetical protein [Candidatus Poribacteria bacterium]